MPLPYREARMEWRRRCSFPEFHSACPRHPAQLGRNSDGPEPALADVPTIAEFGYPGYQQNEWYGVVVPAGTPREVIDRLATELAHTVAQPEVQARLTHLGLYPVEKSGPEALGALIRAELPRWREIVREAGIKAE